MKTTKRDKILSEYEVNGHGIITSPGKFEGEMLYMPYFYEMMLCGMDDAVVYDGRQLLYSVFEVFDEDLQLFPELEGRTEIRLAENDQGFIYETNLHNTVK